MKNMNIALCVFASLMIHITANAFGQDVKPATIKGSPNKSKSKQISIKGNYTVAPKAGEMIYLSLVLDKKSKKYRKVDSVKVTGTNFTMSPKGILPASYILTNKSNQSLPIYLDYGENRIKIDSLFSRAKIKGNTLDSLLKKYDGMNLMVAMMQMGYAFKAINYENEGKKVPKEEEDAFVESFLKVSAEQKEMIRELGSRKDLVGAYVLVNGGAKEFNTTEINEIYAGLSASDKRAPFGVDLKTYLDKLNSLAVGIQAPDFTQKTPEGNEIQLSQFVKGKKLVLVDFWASWCIPCRKENPNVVALYNEFKTKGFDIIGVSLDNKEESWLKAIEDDKLTWTHVSDLAGWANPVAKLYNITAVPHTLLLDGNGKILAKNLKGEELRKKVAEICQ